MLTQAKEMTDEESFEDRGDWWSEDQIDKRCFANPESARAITRIDTGIYYVFVADNLCS